MGEAPTRNERCHDLDDFGLKVTISVGDYDRLLSAAEADDMLLWCETCGAWIDRDDPAAAYTEDFIGCWKAATCGEQELCRSYRASDFVAAIRGRREMERRLAAERAALQPGKEDGDG